MTEARAILSLIGRSFVDPRGVARLLNGLRLNRGILWSALAAVVCLSVLMMTAAIAVSGLEEGHPLFALTPFTLAIVLGSSLVAMVFAFYFTGQMLGGTGRFPGALILMTWWQVMALAVQALQLVALGLSTWLAEAISLLGFGYLIVSLAIFIDVLHGFDNIFKAAGTVVLAVLGISFGLALLMTLIGVATLGTT